MAPIRKNSYPLFSRQFFIIYAIASSPASTLISYISSKNADKILLFIN